MRVLASLRKSGATFKKRMRRHVDDTDWFVHKLYAFAPSMGITLIKANLSRWVIDLNRNPDSAPLYNDGRLITSNTPTTDFFGIRSISPGRKNLTKRRSAGGKKSIIGRIIPICLRFWKKEKGIRKGTALGCTFYSAQSEYYTERSFSRYDTRQQRQANRISKNY